jgi:hypothetical protein
VCQQETELTLDRISPFLHLVLLLVVDNLSNDVHHATPLLFVDESPVGYLPVLKLPFAGVAIDEMVRFHQLADRSSALEPRIGDVSRLARGQHSPSCSVFLAFLVGVLIFIFVFVVVRIRAVG